MFVAIPEKTEPMLAAIPAGNEILKNIWPRQQPTNLPYTSLENAYGI